jgi:transposase
MSESGEELSLFFFTKLKKIFMTSLLKYSVGVDISKNKFDACLAVLDTDQRVVIKSSKSSFSNNGKGFGELVAWIKKHLKADIPLTICMEATGVYYEQLAWYLFENQYNICVILPNKAKSYIKSLGFKSKNDKIDAKGLATMGAQQQLRLWKPMSAEIHSLRHLTRFYQQLQESRTMYKNQLHALQYSRIENKVVTESLETLLAMLETQIKETKAVIQETLEADPILWNKVQHIIKIKGVGLITIATTIAETDGFALFENSSQLVSYSGYDVIEDQSGKRKGKTKISKHGNNRIRRILFLPALNVVKYKVAPFVGLFNRLFERTKVKMKAYVAIQRKLLVLIYTLWKRNEPFQKNYHPEMGARSLSFH